MQVSQTIKNAFPHVLGIVLIVGMVFALSKGIDPTHFGQGVWGYISAIASIVLVALLCFSLYKQEILDRILLGFTLFMLIASVGCLGNIPSILYYYSNYTSIILFGCFIFVGIFTFFTSAGFIGVESDDKNKVNKASLKLFAVVIAGGLWSLYTTIYLKNSSFLEMLPIFITRSTYDSLGNEIRGKQPKRSWKFKWKY